VLGAWGAPQRKKGKGKAKAGSGGAGGGPSTKAAAAGSSGEGSSSQGSSRPSAPPARTIGLSTEEPAVQLAEAASGALQTQPQPAGGGSTKADKERVRKERQRQRKMDEARDALYHAIEKLEEAKGSVEAVEEALQAAAKHDNRCDALAALMDVGRTLVERARAAEAAAEQLEEQAAALTL